MICNPRDSKLKRALVASFGILSPKSQSGLRLYTNVPIGRALLRVGEILRDSDIAHDVAQEFLDLLKICQQVNIYDGFQIK